MYKIIILHIFSCKNQGKNWWVGIDPEIEMSDTVSVSNTVSIVIK